MDLLIHVVRAFDDDDITHVSVYLLPIEVHALSLSTPRVHVRQDLILLGQSNICSSSSL